MTWAFCVWTCSSRRRAVPRGPGSGGWLAVGFAGERLSLVRTRQPGRAKFCSGCGVALAAEPLAHDERTVVMVLFADLVGFTSQARAVGLGGRPGAAAAVLRAAEDRAEAVRRDGGESPSGMR
jgi:hypothetical protein